MIIAIDPDRRIRSKIAKELDSAGELLQGDSLADLNRLGPGEAGEIEVVILGPSLERDIALQGVEHLRAIAPEVSVLLINSDLTPDFLRRALRAGIKDVLPESYSPEDLLEAVDRVAILSRQLKGRSHAPSSSNGHTPPTSGRVITIFSSKGGCGKSFVASNLATLLAQRTGQQVALVDLDLQSGDLAIMLQVNPSWTIHDVAEHMNGLDADALRGYLTPHSSGIFLMAAPLDPSLAEGISAQAVTRVLEILKKSFPYVVIDLPAFFNDQTIAALDISDDVVLMGSMEIPSIKNLKLSLATLGQMGITRDRVRMLLNRADSKVGLTIPEVEKTLGTSIDVAVPSSIEVPQSINRGIPLAIQRQKSPVVAAIAKLAAGILIHSGQAKASPAHKGILAATVGLFGKS